MIVYNNLYANPCRTINSFDELQKLVINWCEDIGDPVRNIRAVVHGTSARMSKTYLTYEFEAVHNKKLIDGRLFREHVVFEVISDEDIL